MNFQHYPVMHKQIIDIFRGTSCQWFIDCTLGMGGHTSMILQAFPQSRVIGIDTDAESLEKARLNLAPFSERVEFLHLNYSHLFDSVDFNSRQISGIIIDPGISTFQLKEGERGFSHSIDAPLDMRKNREAGISAADIIRTYTEKELIRIFETYGEIPKAPELAKRIIEARLFQPVDTTLKLARIIEKLYNWHPKKGKTHPAANVFQALRIEVNKELEGMEIFFDLIPQYIKAHTRIMCLSFHSIEDRLVKQRFVNWQKEGRMNIIKPFPALPSQEEVEENLASRSAKLRVGEWL